MELNFYWLITFLGSERREDHLGDSSSRNTFNVLDTCRILAGPFLMKTLLRLPRIFLSIYMAHPPHSLYFILADLRERKPIAFDFVNPSFTFVSFSVIIFKDILLHKANLTVSSISFFFFLIFCL